MRLEREAELEEQRRKTIATTMMAGGKPPAPRSSPAGWRVAIPRCRSSPRDRATHTASRGALPRDLDTILVQTRV